MPPLSQAFTVASYVLRKKLRGIEIAQAIAAMLAFAIEL